MENPPQNSKSLVLITRVGSTPTTGIKRQLGIERFWAAFLFLLNFLYFGVFREDIDDCIRRGHLTGEIQMCINVACSADIAVSQPLLNLLQAHAIGIEQTGAAMTQVVETDFFQSVVFQYNLEMLCDEVWFDKFAHCIYIDIIQIFFAVGCTAYWCGIKKVDSLFSRIS